jgi:hypothetical protein
VEDVDVKVFSMCAKNSDEIKIVLEEGFFCNLIIIETDNNDE